MDEGRRLGPQSHVLHDAAGPHDPSTEEVFAPNKKVVAFGLPGAFTPTWSAKNVPGFVAVAAVPTAAVERRASDLVADCAAQASAFEHRLRAWRRGCFGWPPDTSSVPLHRPHAVGMRTF